MRLALYVFAAAGVWGVVIVTPLFWMAELIGRRYPPAITHPGFYYGFLVVTLAWQVVFLIVASDPIRYRPIMPAAMLEKFGYVLALSLLWHGGGITAGQFAVAIPDLVLGLLFVAAFVATRQGG